MDFKDRLKELRLEKEMRQEDLAKKIGVSRHTITGYEIGKREPDLDKIIKLANFFDVSIDYLLGNTNIRELNKNVDFIAVIDKAKKEKVTVNDIDNIIELLKNLRERN